MFIQTLVIYIQIFVCSPNAFVIITPNRVFSLQAVSPFEMHRWIGGMLLCLLNHNINGVLNLHSIVS